MDVPAKLRTSGPKILKQTENHTFVFACPKRTGKPFGDEDDVVACGCGQRVSSEPLGGWTLVHELDEVLVQQHGEFAAHTSV